jgi:transposase
MARSRVNYSSGFKDEAVRLVIETSRPVADVARELSVHEGTSGVLGKAAAFFAQEYR